jgi:serine/threonine protein kinase
MKPAGAAIYVMPDRKPWSGRRRRSSGTAAAAGDDPLLAPGTRLGPYEVVSRLGKGAMGEVYRARDVRLGRFVALKVVLPSELNSRARRLRRFDFEARAASALSHPNVVSIHDVGRRGDLRYLAMELVEGRTLEAVLERGPLPIAMLLEVAVQLADGIAAAHDAGIVHRDLKPANIMLSKDRFVKILDFGLARSDGFEAELGAAEGPTETSPATVPGAILGTAAYMSPEQAMGEQVDERSDQFSIGSILYEMATGKRPFDRPTRMQTLFAIAKDDPERISGRRHDIPAPLAWVIERCLEKSPADRYRSSRDLALDLRTIRTRLGELASGPGAAGWSRWTDRSTISRVVAFALAAVAGAGVWSTALRLASRP